MSQDTNTKDFIREIIEQDLNDNKHDGKIVTRFPPEPNGYLHIGHAKSICLNFGIAKEYGGICSLRFDDTNPAKEEREYVESIKEDVKWLGFDWEDRLYFTSDYFEKLYEFALKLINDGKAYVDSLSAEQIREYRGTLTVPGKESPYRTRTISDNLDLFEKMKDGQFDEGEHVLRAKIDMASGNINMRDPVIYRIIKTPHHRTGSKFNIYPTYDFAHGQSDSIEGVTHSLCTLEFEDHRPLYDWFIKELGIHVSRQIEFARLNLTYTILSKRKLSELVKNKHVSGWDDPRMPTISGLRRRGFTPASIINFCDQIGVSKNNSIIDLSLLEYCIREDLNKKALRTMAVLDPIKLIIDNYPDDIEEQMHAINNPEDESMGTRKVPFSKTLYIEKDDFREESSKKFYRLSPGKEVRLRYAYYVTCTGFNKDESTGDITEVHCTYDPATKGGSSPDGRKVKGTIHWVSARHCIESEVRLYDRLFSVPEPDSSKEEKDYKEYLNPDSIKVLKNCKLEPSLKDAKPYTNYQFERLGYFCLDPVEYKDCSSVFNRTISMRDSWAKLDKK
ncbi:MAG: glutamine--tRNA ligase/YqeY domain fusion protein [Candidatus Dadabacteria bacterium]|nr:glutamine--tRNA ligase/YqeY domain fusion protein [Candidatus Dadabacteria bacterium]NIX15560.1 glutamine--tRNA ligase/YqeY domain fusion protein [Candidatus Dadabacteria bacterium]NIY22300.1 glutamine--tRNA ligase/YqeY domain fusion protein [Candidatus Dadabacteria bacterium]